MNDNELSNPNELIRDLPPTIRPSSRLTKLGVEALKESELLALVLNSRSLSKAEKLLERQSVKVLLAMPYEWLVAQDGISRAGAAALLAAAELTRRTDRVTD